MKKLFITLVAFALALTNIETKAQVVVQDNINGENQVKNDVSKTKDETEQNNSSLEVDYQGYEKGTGFGFSLVIKHLFLSGSTISFDDIKDFAKNRSAWNVSAGYNYRYYLAKIFYIEGRAGIGYHHYSEDYVAGDKVTEHHSPSLGDWSSTTADWKEHGNGEFFLTINPRVGLKLFRIGGSDFNINAGYRWDFIKFKFGKENTNDYFTVGASLTF